MDENLNNIPLPKKAQRKRLGLLVFIPLMLGIIAIFILSIEWRDSLKIQRIVVRGAHILRAQDVYALANIRQKSPIFELNILGVQNRIEKHPFIKAVSVNRQIPDEISIEIIEREPIASIGGGEFHYIDAEGIVLPYIQSSVQLDLPTISGVDGLDKIVQGKNVSNDQLSQAIEILQTAFAVDTTVFHLISEINMNNGNDVILYSAEGGVPIMLGKGDTVKKLLLLQKFWNDFIKTSDPEKLRYVDLRFDGQVVVKWNQQPDNISSKL